MGKGGRPGNKRQTTDPSLLVKKALNGAKKCVPTPSLPLFLLRWPCVDFGPALRVAQTATTVIGTVASEIAGERVLQPNSPASMVTAALEIGRAHV